MHYSSDTKFQSMINLKECVSLSIPPYNERSDPPRLSSYLTPISFKSMHLRYCLAGLLVVLILGHKPRNTIRVNSSHVGV